ncbi:carbohydrate sulfotransferase 1-like [Protopterus annectens]|uniref:carbohydrate sulfotransferase 1-like n=1 Tax=Protopterus annectens TaxID=7888 RepID=UPI001CF999EC|nr:carbohydrate sulfotransferase 1-like [Protopterus annectens]XP_043944086.1 carbohydrate sulfotransferase 1-like [Protopterus annectens]XP_043944088.1 carbohydrate sulfotransferase 1-like [Protopterus annectens]
MMECSWKIVILLLCAYLGIQYTAIMSLKPMFIRPCQGMGEDGHCQHRDLKDYKGAPMCEEPPFSQEFPQEQGRKHIIIFAMTRSGSSFMGQIFNQHPDVFYLFEPLYHVQIALTKPNTRNKSQANKSFLLGAFRDLLRNLCDCDFYFLENYIKPVPKDHDTPLFFRRGASRALCSPPVCDVPQDLEEVEENVCSKMCHSLNLTLASQACQNCSHMAIKIVRVPEIKDLRTLVEDPRLNLKIVHLVRDPRGILTSRIATFFTHFRMWKIWNVTGQRPHNIDLTQITTLCTDMLNSADTGLSKPSWLRGKYMLVRYEDLAKEPVKKAKEIYKFVGLNWNDRISKWILQNTKVNITPSEYNKFSTSRNSSAVAESWRLNLSFDIVKTVQNVCNATLSRLGYRSVHSVEELRNLSHSVVEPIEMSACYMTRHCKCLQNRV